MNPDYQSHASTIDQIRQETEEAENLGNAAEMSKYFASDIVLMGPNMPAISGVENVTAAMQGFFDTFDFEIHYSSEEITVCGGWAFDRGTYQQMIGPKRLNKPVEETGKYLWLYVLENGSNWKQARIMWNSSDVSVVSDT